MPVPRMPAGLSRSTWVLLRIVGSLLVLQAVGLAVLAWWSTRRIDWEVELADILPSTQALETIYYGVSHLSLAVLVLIVALAFWTLRRWAWVAATATEGLVLANCLFLYFWWPENSLGHSFTNYAVMVYCIVMVLYLNNVVVRTSFAPSGREAPAEASHAYPT